MRALLTVLKLAGPGFLNFYLTKDSLAKIIRKVRLQDQDYGKSEYGKGKRVLIEFVSANPTGPLTIAHGRQAAIGDVLARVLAATGHEVHREYYLNDAGRQMNLLGESLWARYAQALGEAIEVPEEGYQGDYLIEMGKSLAEEKGDELFQQGKEKGAEACRIYACEEMMGRIKVDLQNFWRDL